MSHWCPEAETPLRDYGPWCQDRDIKKHRQVEGEKKESQSDNKKDQNVCYYNMLCLPQEEIILVA